MYSLSAALKFPPAAFFFETLDIRLNRGSGTDTLPGSIGGLTNQGNESFQGILPVLFLSPISSGLDDEDALAVHLLLRKADQPLTYFIRQRR